MSAFRSKRFPFLNWARLPIPNPYIAGLRLLLPSEPGDTPSDVTNYRDIDPDSFGRVSLVDSPSNDRSWQYIKFDTPNISSGDITSDITKIEYVFHFKVRQWSANTGGSDLAYVSTALVNPLDAPDWQGDPFEPYPTLGSSFPTRFHTHDTQHGMICANGIHPSESAWADGGRIGVIDALIDYRVDLTGKDLATILGLKGNFNVLQVAQPIATLTQTTIVDIYGVYIEFTYREDFNPSALLSSAG